MKKQWHSIKNLQDNGQKIISAEVTLEPESCWFDGHFPGFPILPGIAQLAIVSDMLKADVKFGKFGSDSLSGPMIRWR
jgi:3-hydroxymyristoyl/3-hydroxydecanoyl-(acyl carrier protein) dehydratase